MDNPMSTNPSGWFFAEWISIIGTFVVCFVFLFYQNQVQSARTDKLQENFMIAINEQHARSDKLYEQFQSAINEQNVKSNKLYEMFYEIVREKK